MTKRLKYSLIVTGKLIIVGFAFWAIYTKLSTSVTAPDLQAFIKDTFSPSFFWFVLLLLTMMLINWMLEAQKWRTLVAKLETIGYWYALKAVISGSTLGIFTPNRIGDIAGRVLFLKAEHRLKALVCTAVGSLAQMMVIIISGLLAAIFFALHFVELEHSLLYLLLYLSLIALVLLYFIYFNINWIAFLTDKWIKNERFRKVIGIMSTYTTAELGMVLFLSFARYAIYSTQYALLVAYLIPGLNWIELMALISLIYFVQAVVPAFAMADLGIRGATAIYFIGFVSTDVIAILAASVIGWCINIMFPALVGAVFFIQQRFFDDTIRPV